MFDFAGIKSPAVLIAGECMLELALPEGLVGASPATKLAMGGDTLNTAVYLSRLGAKVSYLTALGDDPYSEWMLEQWRGEGVDTSAVQRLAGAVPGMYAIQTDAHGERSFHYWRAQSAAKQWFSSERSKTQWLELLSPFGVFYLSGITLSLMTDAGRETLVAALQEWRARGGCVVFDINFRPKGWVSRPQAQQVMSAMLTVTDVGLPTLDDEQDLFDGQSEEDVIARYQTAGVTEILIKRGPSGVVIAGGAERFEVPARRVDKVVDTTGAGDSFNAGYLAGRLAQLTPEQAALQAHQLAAAVIGARGAIIPRSQTSVLAHGGSGLSDSGSLL